MNIGLEFKSLLLDLKTCVCVIIFIHLKQYGCIEYEKVRAGMLERLNSMNILLLKKLKSEFRPF